MQAFIAKKRRRKRQEKRNRAKRPKTFKDFHSAIRATVERRPDDRHVEYFGQDDHVIVLVTSMRENEDDATRRGVLGAIRRMLRQGQERRKERRAQ